MTHKFTILCQLFYPELVSTGQTITELAEELSGQGIEVSIIAAPPSIDPFRKKTPSKLTYKGISVIRLWATQFPKLSFIGRLCNAITFSISTTLYLLFSKDKSPILVLTNPPFLGWILAFINRRKFNYLVFDVYPDTAIENGLMKKNSLLATLWRTLNSYTYQKAANIIVIGRCMKSIIEKEILDHTKIKLTHVWADDRGIQASITNPSYFRKKWNIENKFILLYSGNMGRFHDMETILYAAKALQDHDDIVFLFIGEGHKKRWIKDYIQHESLKNCIVDTYVNREDLGNLLATADIGLVSLLDNQVGLSVPSKTFGLLAAGCPVLGLLPNKSEISLILTEENCGRVTPPKDVNALIEHILKLKKSPALLKTLGENGKKAIQTTYNLSHAAKTIASTFF